MAKQAHQQVPDPVDANDVATKTFVERLGGRGAPDFIHKVMSTTQTGIGAGTVIEFDLVKSSRGLTSSGFQFVGLKAGRTYLLLAQIRSDSGSFITSHWYNVTAGAPVDPADDTLSVSEDFGHSFMHQVFVPTVDTTLEVRAQAVSTSESSQLGVASVIEMGGSGGLGGPLEHIETITVGASVASVTFDGLDGDTDEQYLVVGRYAKPGNTANDVTLQPNGLTASQMSVRRNLTSAGLFVGTYSTLLVADSTNQFTYFKASLDAKTGQPRHHLSDSVNSEPGVATTDLKGHQCYGKWDDTSTNITSLVVAIAGTTFEPGSEFSLYRLKRSNASNIVARTVLTADATTLSLTGLDGDTDREYEITGTLITSTGVQRVDIAPNGSTTSMQTVRRVSSVSTGVDSTVGHFSDSGATGTYNILRFRMRFWAARTINGVAVNRGFECTAAHQFGTTADVNANTIAGNYDDASANLTSLDFINTVASAILAGSEVTVRRIDVG